MTKDDVAAALDEIGTLLELKGENAFRCNAYHSAARTIGKFAGDVQALVAAAKAGEIRGVGDAMKEKIETLVVTGSLSYLDELRSSIPSGLVQLLRLPGVGPKKVKAMFDELGIDSVEKLKEACGKDEVAKLKGFGAKTQQKILDGIAFLGTVGNRVRIDLALALGNTLLEQIRGMPGVKRAELCGSIRRRRETAKDIDIVASAKDAGPIMEAFVTLPQVMQVVGHGETKSSIVAQMNAGTEKVVLNADLRVVTETQFPFAVMYLTGSKAHNIRLRQRALDRGWSLNEYGLSDVKCKSEEDIYKALGLEFVLPELREDTGEVEAAEAHRLPVLVEQSQIRGVFHNHTKASDGRATLEEMALAAKALGFEFFGVGDHSKSLTIANGLAPDRVKAQWAEVDALNQKLKGVTIFKGTECDILSDGAMDYDDKLLAGFDYVVASVHSHFNLTLEEQTKRVCRALSNPHVTMLGHATGRLLLRRDGYKIDLEEVIKTAAKNHKMIEINAQPDRLDLDWTYVKRAKSLGVPLVINPDAHATAELALYEYGVHVARRGWLTKEEVFNTRSAKDVAKEFAKRRSK
jgi:DNA polymerase (family 10)